MAHRSRLASRNHKYRPFSDRHYISTNRYFLIGAEDGEYEGKREQVECRLELSTPPRFDWPIMTAALMHKGISVFLFRTDRPTFPRYLPHGAD
jgi:hypothetical protein